jgi:hypothetical protein
MSGVSQNPDQETDVTLIRLITDGKNPRGIPSAKFIVWTIDRFFLGGLNYFLGKRRGIFRWKFS